MGEGSARVIVSDVAKSQAFWVGMIGFEVMYARPEEGFVYLNLAGAHIMLEQAQPEQWLPAPLQHPFGNGINVQIEVPATTPILARLGEHDWPLFAPLEERWYQADAVEHGQRQFLVQDPDGYLLRLVEVLGNRPYRA